MSPMVVIPGVTGGLVLALLWYDYREIRWGRWIAKPLASAGFIAMALYAGGTESTYGRAMLVALVLSWFGDVFLLGRGQGFFLAGLGSFLLAHLAFASAFFMRGFSPWVLALAILALAIPAMIIGRWLMPHTSSSLRAPVILYLVVISIMVALALASVASRWHWGIALGVVAFYFSDLSVANDRLIAPSFFKRLWGVPLYYAAQLFLAASVAAK